MERGKFDEVTCHLRALLRCAYDRRTTHTSELAAMLNLSECTVNSYWKEVKRILDVSEHYQAVALAKEKGLLENIPQKRGGAKEEIQE